MKILIAAGGTGGHVYPALALANYIKMSDKDTEFLFVGTKTKLEATKVPEAGYNFQAIDVIGLSGNPLQRLKALNIFRKSIRQSKKIIKQFQPDVVVGFGGYPSSSVVWAAHSLGIKTLIHEQNSMIGLTNKILINKADAIIACYQISLEQFPREKTQLLGNPRATEVINEVGDRDILRQYNLDNNKKTVLIFMGSLGSETVNEVIMNSLSKFAKKDYQVLYITGPKHYDLVKNKVGETSKNVAIISYCDQMPTLLNKIDLVVSRAGASTLAELTSLGVASILIPSPYVAKNHQEYNAKELVDKNAARMILEKDLTTDTLLNEIDNVLNNKLLNETLKVNAKKLGKPSACADIYSVIKSLVENR